MSGIHYASLIGLPQANAWSQVAINSSKNLIAAFAITGENAKNIGKNFQHFIENTDRNIASVNLYQNILNTINQIQEEADDCQLAAIYLCPNSKVIFFSYQSCILLKRNEKIGQILQSTHQLQVLQGKYTNDDLYVLATEQAQPLLEEIKQKFQTGYDIETVIDSMIPAVHSDQNSSLTALCFINFEPKSNTADKKTNDLAKSKIQASTERTAAEISLELATNEEMTALEDGPKISQENLDDIETQKASHQTEQNLNQSTKPIKKGIELKKIFQVMRNVSRSFTELINKIFKNAHHYRQNLIIKAQSQKAKAQTEISDLGIIEKKAALLTAESNNEIKKESKQKAFPQKKTPQLIVKNMVIFGKTFKNKIFNLPGLIKSSFFSKDVYVMKQSPRKITGMILILTFFFSTLLIGFIFWQSQKKAEITEVEKKLQNTINLINSSHEQAESDPITARDQISQVINQLDQFKKDYQHQKYASQIIEQYLNEAKKYYQEISGKEELSELNIFLDLSQIQNDFIGQIADLSGNRLVISDPGKKQLISLDLDIKQTKLYQIEADIQIQDIVLDDKTLYILGNGIHQYDLEEQKLTTLKEEGDSDRAGTKIGFFVTYLYVLNPEKRNIYRYSRQKDQLSDPIGWLISKKDLDFQQISSLAIDGDLWLTDGLGQLKKFARGNEEEFNISGLTDPFTSKLKIYTKENLANLYILDPDKKRIVILNKQGQFVREIKYIALAGANTFIVSEEQGKIYVVSGSLIFDLAL